MRRLWTLLVSLVLVVGVVGCQSDAGSGVAGDGGGGGSAGADGFPRTVEHAMGRTEIPKKPVRVVALDQTFVDATLILQTEVVGYTEIADMKDGKLPDYFGDTLQYAKSAVSVGTLDEPSLEKIAELKPDLIVSAKQRHEELHPQLSQIAPTVFSESTGAVWKENLELVAEATGKEDLGEELLDRFEERAEKIGDNIAADRGELPTISIARFSGGGTIRCYIEESYAGEVLKDVGFTRPEGQPSESETVFVELSPENIPELEADVIFVSTWADPEASKDRDKLTANPLWKTLKGETIVVDDTIWMTAVGLQGAQALLDDLAKKFEVDPATDLR